MEKWSNRFQNAVKVLSWGYVFGVLLWLALYLLLGDRVGFMGLFNAFAMYLFVPLPLVLLTAVGTRAWKLAAGSAALLVVFLLFWGGLFLPGSAPQTNGDSLRVMSYNIFGRVAVLEAIAINITEEQPDVILMQEVTYGAARYIEEQLGDSYPYRILNARGGSGGLGVISKYPLSVLDNSPSGDWGKGVQVLQLDWNGLPVALVNFHFETTSLNSLGTVDEQFQQRQANAQALADYVTQNLEGQLVIATGDANSVQLSDAYKIIRASGLHDAWLEAGFGLGNTYPGSPFPDRRRVFFDGFPLLSIPLPEWVVRIDYVFYSPGWQAVEAHMAYENGGSDHRGVVVELALARAE